MNEKRIKEIELERFGSWSDNGKACKGCIFSNGFPDQCTCSIYSGSKLKPDNVFLEGEHCKYYREK